MIKTGRTMVNVVIDANYIFHKTFGIFSNFGSREPGDILSSDGERDMFVRKVITDICYSLNQIPDINKVIFCRDSRSWRKDYKISRSVYKESRVKSEGTDWGSFFALLDELGVYLEENGFIYNYFPGAEGDDLIWGWCDHLKNSEHSVIVLSGDKDMNQLVRGENGRWTIIWNSNSKNNRLWVPEGWKLEEEKETSIFDVTPTSGSGNNKLNKLVSLCEIEHINVKEFVFKKILTGDKKDDVPGVFPYSLKEGKNSNVTEGKAQKIWDHYSQSPWFKKDLKEIWEDDEFLEWLSGLSLRMIAQSDTSENRNNFKRYFQENASLLWLDEEVIPEDIKEGIRDKIIESEKNSRKPLNLDKKSLIENSKWGSDSPKPKGFDPFELFN